MPTPVLSGTRTEDGPTLGVLHTSPRGEAGTSSAKSSSASGVQLPPLSSADTILLLANTSH